MSLFNKMFNNGSNKDVAPNENKLPEAVEMALGKMGPLDKTALWKAIDLVDNQEHLKLIATESTIDQARMWVARMLEDKDVTNSVYDYLRKYSNDPLIKMAAQQEYKEPQIDSAQVDESDWKNENREIAIAAINKIDNQDLLIEIVKGKNYRVEHEAQKRLLEILDSNTEQDVLFDIVDSFGFIPLRIKAVELLTDRGMLEQIANKAYFMGEDINEAARKRLSEL